MGATATARTIMNGEWGAGGRVPAPPTPGGFVRCTRPPDKDLAREGCVRPVLSN